MTSLPQRLLDLANILDEVLGPEDAETCRKAAEVIERLPVTADGFVLHPDMDVWNVVGDEILGPLTVRTVERDCCELRNYRSNLLYLRHHSSLYSTEQAAKAKEKTQ